MLYLKLSIEGDFWNTQLYMGRMYLWFMDGKLSVYNWDELINLVNAKYSRLHYNIFTAPFSDNKLINEIVLSHLKSSPIVEVSLTLEEIESTKIQEIENPYKELPTSMDIFNKKIYAGLDKGFWALDIDNTTDRFINSKATKLWDNQIVNIKSSLDGRIAISAAEDGLFEYDQLGKNVINNAPKLVEKSITQLSEKYSSFADYIYSSLYSSSNYGESFLFFITSDLFRRRYTPELYNKWLDNNIYKLRNNFKLNYKSEIKDSELLGDSIGLSWGKGNKIVKASGNIVDIYELGPFLESNDAPLIRQIKRVELYNWKGSVISGTISHFGVIIEAENALVIVNDSINLEHDSITIEGPVTNWKDFPKSKNYKYLLSVVFDDKISFYSFPDTYLTTKYEKNIYKLYNK